MQIQSTASVFPTADTDRAQQKALLSALNAWDRALRRDECGAWAITGSRGTIHTWGDGKTWVLYLGCRSARHWTSTKDRLAFCAVTQDGDDEGCLKLLDLPTPEQAAVIRDVFGIRKRMQIAPDDLERRRASMTRLAQAKVLGPAGPSVLEPMPEQMPILEAELAASVTGGGVP